MALLEVDDLTPFATIDEDKAAAMIDDALAMAELVAPCINDDDFAYPAAVKAIIRGAILRWNDAGSGAVSQQSAGPFGVTLDTRQARRSMFWPSEIEQLQSLCRTVTAERAFEVDLTPAGAGEMLNFPEPCYPWDVPPVDGAGP